MSRLSAVFDFAGPASPRERFVVLAEARLDNGPELARTLGVAGAPGASAGPLLLAAWLRWGESCPRHLLGDFAFVIWDTARRRLFCARDPLGARALHWSRNGRRLWIAAEARQILDDPSVPADLDEQTVADYLAGLPENPERTFFRHIHAVPPGHSLTVDGAGHSLERYWQPGEGPEIRYRRDEEYAGHLRELLTAAVESRLPAPEETVAITLSGGLDSGSVAALVSRLHPRPFAASIVFDELPECDERPWIYATAAGLGIEVAAVPADPLWFLSDPEVDRPTLETPFLSWDSCFDQVLREVRERGARVILTGHGGDEILGGSPRVYADRLRRGDIRAAWEVARHAARRGSEAPKVVSYYLTQPLAPRLDRTLRRLAGKRLVPPPPLPAWIRGDFIRRSGLEERWAAAVSPERYRRPARADILDNLAGLAGDRALAWYDRRAAGFGIAVRHPFLDRRLVDFVAAIPPGQLFEAGLYKPLLRRAMAGLLPEAVRQRRDKTRLDPFVDLSLREKAVHRIEPLLIDSLAASLEILDEKAFQSAYRTYRFIQPSETERALWYALTLEIWLREHRRRLSLGPPGAGSVAIGPVSNCIRERIRWIR